MFTHRFEQEILLIQRDIQDCERQIAFHQDEMQRAHRHGETEIERFHRQEQLRWERKLRECTRDLIQAEQRLELAKQEEAAFLARDSDARQAGRSRNTWS
ncbi:hypothetical protein [Laceyella sacchari]|uniref:Flagellar FliJ protein n=1 Tax=Laceyella sacchari TaxID=37482 RepID=A0ABY5U609_LACSH|nr:hypothetical protein [Laceyella sacchari]KPC73831.1 hypothetical protein ADL26_12295 [Thermoactinomyces vulgaris]TCW40815.1 hypothetical protein EDC32_101463 [Laceyella sacchari]UWE04435.1 hypothetical protein NYR52_04590 [Laceyella sacchari]